MKIRIQRKGMPHLFCWNCGELLEWGRLCRSCMRAMLIGAATAIGSGLVGWYFGA